MASPPHPNRLAGGCQCGAVRYEISGKPVWAQALAQVAAIGTTLAEVFERATRAGRPTHEVADRIARERIAAGRQRQSRPALQAVPRRAAAAS